MDLMFIQQFQVALSEFENLTPQPSYDAVRRQQVVAFDAILVG